MPRAWTDIDIMDGRPLPRVFNLLSVEKDPAVEDSLLEALPHLGTQARDAALKLMCDRGRASALAAVLAACSSFDSDLKEQVYRRLDGLHSGLRALIQSEKLEDRAAAVAAILGASDFKSAYLLSDCLRSSCSRTRELAAGAIHHLTEELFDERLTDAQPRLLSEFLDKRQRLSEALKTVISNWESHQHLTALKAALWLIDCTEKTLAEKVDQPPSKLVHALEGLLERVDDPRLAPFVLCSLATSVLKPSAAKCLSQSHAPEFLSSLAEQTWLLRDPNVEHGLRGASVSQDFDHWISAAQQCRPEIAAGVVEMISLGGPRDKALARLMAIRQTACNEVRRAVLWRLVADDSHAATQELGVIASRADDPQSAIAARECKRRQRRETAALPPKETNPASLALTRALNMFTEEHDRIEAVQREELAGQLRSLGPELSRQLERRLETTRGHEHVQSLRVIRTLGLVREFLPQIYRSVRDSEPLVRSTALELLHDDPSPTAIRLAREAVNDPEPRVQATAIEVLEKLGVSAALPAVRARLRSPSNRVRANAIKALWTVELHLAAAELEKMLKDESPEHRISALWVVERLRIKQILDRLQSMSCSDADPRVRSRAGRALKRLGDTTGLRGTAHAR